MRASPVLTPASDVGDTALAVYCIPVADAVPAPKPAAERRRAVTDSIATLDEPSGWSTSLFSWMKDASLTAWLRIVLCPCATAATVNERLGSSFEVALLYFGVLASAMFVFFGLSITYCQQQSDDHDGDRHFRHDHEGRPPFQDWNGSMPGSFEHGPPPFTMDKDTSVWKSPSLWAALTVASLALFLLGVWLLRDQTRNKRGLPGTKLGDLVVSCACCFCAVAQMDAELISDRKPRRKPEPADNGSTEASAVSDAPDTLPPYPVISALV